MEILDTTYAYIPNFNLYDYISSAIINAFLLYLAIFKLFLNTFTLTSYVVVWTGIFAGTILIIGVIVIKIINFLLKSLENVNNLQKKMTNIFI